MDSKIFKNSYVVFILTFIVLYILFYLLGIGYVTEVEYDKSYQPHLVLKPSWKYPLALALIVWVFWHFYMYPAADIKLAHINQDDMYSEKKIVQTAGSDVPQKIDMKNWYY